jgi:hypothetical protein
MDGTSAENADSGLWPIITAQPLTPPSGEPNFRPMETFVVEIEANTAFLANANRRLAPNSVISLVLCGALSDTWYDYFGSMAADS